MGFWAVIGDSKENLIGYISVSSCSVCNNRRNVGTPLWDWDKSFLCMQWKHKDHLFRSRPEPCGMLKVVCRLTFPKTSTIADSYYANLLCERKKIQGKVLEEDGVSSRQCVSPHDCWIRSWVLIGWSSFQWLQAIPKTTACQKHCRQQWGHMCCVLCRWVLFRDLTHILLGSYGVGESVMQVHSSLERWTLKNGTKGIKKVSQSLRKSFRVNRMEDGYIQK